VRSEAGEERRLNMVFSILIPTRKRIQLLEHLIESISRTVHIKSNVEILIAYDTDDFTTDNWIENFNNQTGIDIRFYKRDRSLNINGDYYNWLALRHSTGKYFIAVNDDTRFTTDGWDVFALEAITKYIAAYPDEIFLGITEDEERIRERHDGNRFTCFPLFSKEALRVLGFLFQPEYWRDGADWIIGAVYRRIGRILDLRNAITIQHLSVRSNRRCQDEQYDEYVKLCHMCPEPPTFDVITRDARILQHYIEYKEILRADQVDYAKTGWKFIPANGA
jgi:hypothetical protein